MARSTKTEGVKQDTIKELFFNQIKALTKTRDYQLDAADKLIKEAEEGI